MAQRIIVWTYTAQKQRRSILEYWTIKNSSTLYAEKLIRLISEQTILISKNPTAFRLTDFKDIRVSSLGHFGIFYKYNASTYYYIGDNVKKDFITPNQIGWITIGLLDAGTNIHKQDMTLPMEFQPNYFVKNILEVESIILK